VMGLEVSKAHLDLLALVAGSAVLWLEVPF
jgi:hypothetical protein